MEQGGFRERSENIGRPPLRLRLATGRATLLAQRPSADTGPRAAAERSEPENGVGSARAQPLAVLLERCVLVGVAGELREHDEVQSRHELAAFARLVA